jgi:CheY-like chemotaxis protein
VLIIMMTASANQIDQIKALTPNFNGFLRNPFTPDALLWVISELLEV